MVDNRKEVKYAALVAHEKLQKKKVIRFLNLVRYATIPLL